VAQVAGIDLNKLNARSLGFVLGPHLNAAGRLQTAELSLELLTTTDALRAVDIAYQLHDMNVARRADQDRITKQALVQAAQFADDPVLVLSDANWSHGIIGIVAAKILENQRKPTFILQEIGEEAKGSARSFGDFSAVDAIKAAEKWLIKGGGHKLAAGVTLKTQDIANFRQAINTFYKAQKLKDQHLHFEPRVDAIVQDVGELNHNLMQLLKTLEPFGHGNPEPVFHLPRAVIHKRQALGKEATHLKLLVGDSLGNRWQLIGFGMAGAHAHEVGEEVSVWFKLIENEWGGTVRLEGQLLKLAEADI
jgi:single-stranded-DNA-specific exonuclease